MEIWYTSPLPTLKEYAIHKKFRKYLIHQESIKKGVGKLNFSEKLRSHMSRNIIFYFKYRNTNARI